MARGEWSGDVSDDDRSARVSSLREVLSGYLANHGLLGKSKEALAACLWAEVVGPWYAQHTTVTRVRRGVLMVHCDSAPRAQQLQFDSPHILEKLNQRLGGDFVHEIRAASGRVGRGRPDPTIPEGQEEKLPTAQELATIPVPRDQAELIETLAQKLADPGLRAKFTAVMVNFARLQQWRRSQGYQECATCGRLVSPGERCSVCYVGRLPQQGNPDFDSNAERYTGEQHGQRIRRSRRKD